MPDKSKSFNKIFFKAPRFKSQLRHMDPTQPLKVSEAHVFQFVKGI